MISLGFQTCSSLSLLFLLLGCISSISQLDALPGELGISLAGPYRNYLRKHVHEHFIRPDEFDDFGAKSKPKPHWFRHQQVDHFDIQNQQLYAQRYFYNAKYWRREEGGPVFLYIGGESPLSPLSVVFGHHVELAKRYNALVLAVEHRYYGASIPTPDLSTRNLRFLTSQQALADLSTFIAFIQNLLNFKSSTHALMTFGGSYPGVLSAWARRKFPDLIFAAVASSAPVQVRVNFGEYLHGVAVSVSNPHIGGSDRCRESVREAFKIAEQEVESGDKDALARQFASCYLIETDDDKRQFLSSLMAIFEGAVQYNNQVPLNVERICQIMLSESSGTTPYDRLAHLNRLANNSKKKNKSKQKDCHDFRYSKLIQELQKTTLSPSGTKSSSRQWIYQTCSQFGFYQTCEEKTSCIFSLRVDMNSQLKLCKRLFGISPSSVREAVNFTNNYYGGSHIHSSRILFVNGVVDPWHQLSVLKEQKRDEHVVLIQGISHCQDMHSSSKNDSRYLKSARELINKEIGRWLFDFEKNTSHRHSRRQTIK